MFAIDFEDEIDGKIWREELRDFLPDRLLDFHGHLFGPGVEPKRDPTVVRARQTAPDVPDVFGMEDLDTVRRTLFPGKDYRALLFGSVSEDADMVRNNAYVQAATQASGDFALGVPWMQDVEALTALIKEGGFLGYKPYWTLVEGIPSHDITIEAMVPQPLRHAANALGTLIMLHIPRPGRLADPKNIEGIIRLCRECPRAKIVLAHLGRAYMLSATTRLGALLSERLDNLYWEFSNVQNWEAFEVFFQKLDLRRVMYGLDLPVATIKGKMVIVNEQNLFLTKEPFAFSLHNPAKAYPIRCTFYAYEIIRECRKALVKLGKTDDLTVEDLFYNNGMRLIEEVRANLAL